MAKITKTEFLENIQGIINEGLTPKVNFDNTEKFGIRHYVNNLFEDGQRNPRLMSFLKNYKTMLESEGVKDFMVFEEFGQGLAQYATGNKAVKAVINEMNTTIAKYGKELATYRLIECIQDAEAKKAVRDAYNNYLESEDDASHDIFVDAIDACAECGDPAATQLTIIISSDDVNRIPQIECGSPISKFDEIQKKIAEDKERQRMEEVKAQVDAYARKVFDEAEAEKRAEREQYNFENVVNNTGINLRESISRIKTSDARTNKKLMETLEQYTSALNQGLYEERLYEGFIQNITKFNYLNAVNKEIKRINESVAKNPKAIAVTKILEEMSTTNSYYIIPMIEEDACRFVKEPSAVNRGQLRNILCAFIGDPYCAAMLEAIDTDYIQSTDKLQENALSIKDQIKVIRENANVYEIYSPVQYIKENECVFNANGKFYVKKGNTLAPLSEEYLNQLSESFVALCQLVNDPRVIINEDSIILNGTDKIATIYEGYVDVNGNRETMETLRNLNEMCMKYDFDTNFFVMASCLHENFNNIARIDFGKHIALNEDAGINIDMFRLGNNIFVNTVNENMFKSTFYHNVNPIQCRNLINKHMGINVASLFEDLLPSQEKILMKLNETKDEYEASIEKYEATIEKLEKAKEECVSEDNEKKLDAAIEAAKSKVEELKKEYKDWQSNVEKTTTAKSDDEKDDELEDDPNTDVEHTNEPIDDKDVEAAKDELTQPLSAGDAEPMDLSAELSDEEFDSYLEAGDEIPAENIESPDEDMDNAGDETEISMMHHALAGDGRENEEPSEDDVFDEPLEDEEDESDENGFTEINDDSLEDEVSDELSVEEPAEDDMTDASDEELNFEDEDIELPAEELKAEKEVAMPEGYKIADIAFDQNIKTGELFNTGNVTVVCQMVDGEGKMFVDTKTYDFYIDKETHLPIVNAANIPVALYNAIVSSIQSDDQFTNADANGKEVEQSNELFLNNKDVENASDELEADDDEAFFEFEEDPEGETLTISAKENEELPEEPAEFEDDVELPEEEKELSLSDIFNGVESEDDTEDVIIPAYKDGDTEIELPAANVDGTDIPEITDDEVEDVVAADDADVIEFDDDDVELPEDDEEESDEDAEDVKECQELKEFVDVPTQQPAQPANASAGQQPQQGAQPQQPQQGQPANASTGAQPQQGQQPQQAPAQAQPAQQPVNASTGNQPQQGQQPANASTGVQQAQPANESLKVRNSKVTLNEARKAFVKLQAEYKKGDQHFFLNEGTIKPSKKEDARINENLDGIDELNNEALESNKNTFEDMWLFAMQLADNTTTFVSDIQEENGVQYFAINNISGHRQPYTVYQMDNEIYYMPTVEFKQDLEDINDGFEDIDILKMEEGDPEKMKDFIIDGDNKAGHDLIDTLIVESVKIRRPNLSSNGDIEESKYVDDILHGDAERKEFEKNVERETQQAGVDNPLAPAQQLQQEGLLILPNVHQLCESVVYEPEDWVIIKDMNMKAQVVDVVNDGDGKLSMLTIIASNGTVYDVNPNEIEPDPIYLQNIPGNVVNSQGLNVPDAATFDIDPKTRMVRQAKNETPETLKDLNGKTIHVYLKDEGKWGTTSYRALLKDIFESKKMIHVMNEDTNEIAEYDATKDLEFDEMPYAVVVNSEGKPIRSIQIDPLSYIEAGENDMVVCNVNGEETEFPKKCIDVLS